MPIHRPPLPRGAASLLVAATLALLGGLAAPAHASVPGLLADEARTVDRGQMQLGATIHGRIREDTALPLIDSRMNIGLSRWQELGFLLHFDTDGDGRDGLTRPGFAWTGLLMRATAEGRPGVAVEVQGTLPVGLGRARDETLYGLAQARGTWRLGEGRIQLHGNGGVRAWRRPDSPVEATPWWAGRAEMGAPDNGWRMFGEASAGMPRQVSGNRLAFQTGLRHLAADVIGLHLLVGMRPGLNTEEGRQWWLSFGLSMTFDAFRPAGSMGHELGGAGLLTPDPDPFEGR